MLAVKHTISFEELRNASAEQRERMLTELGNAADGPANGEVERIDSEIREYERRYEVSSERMLEELAAGTRKETAEIASWLMRLRIRERLGAVQAG